ncbi:MAG: hypothetical protein QM758_10590 [Armatimonas sp.]
MNYKAYLCGITVMLLATAAQAGGDYYPLQFDKVHGTVLIRRDQSGSHWQRVKPGRLPSGTYLLRTNSHSYVHVSEVYRCVDANSLVRVKSDGSDLPAFTILRGRVSAIDGK